MSTPNEELNRQDSSESPGLNAPTSLASTDSVLPEDLRVPWSWPDLVYFLLFGLASAMVVTLMVQFAALVWFRVTPWEMDSSSEIKATILVVSQALWSGVTLLYLVALVRLRGRGSFWRTLGWRELRSQERTRAAASVACVLGGIGLAVVTQLASALIGQKAKLPIEELFHSRSSVLWLMAQGILVAPLVEETIFRGYIYPVVARRFGIIAGVLGTGTLFGLSHAMQLWGGWGQISLLVGVGVVLTYVRARSGTVLASYLFHLGYNTILFVGFIIATKGLRDLPSGL